MQPRFDRRVGNGPFTLVQQPRFRAGFDFLRLRAQVGEADMALATWWEDFSLADPSEQRQLMERAREEEAARRQAGAPARKTGGRSRRAAGQAESGQADREHHDMNEVDDDEAEAIDVTRTVGEGAAPARKRRRRRRKPAGGAPAGEA